MGDEAISREVLPPQAMRASKSLHEPDEKTTNGQHAEQNSEALFPHLLLQFRGKFLEIGFGCELGHDGRVKRFGMGLDASQLKPLDVAQGVDRVRLPSASILTYCRI